MPNLISNRSVILEMKYSSTDLFTMYFETQLWNIQHEEVTSDTALINDNFVMEYGNDMGHSWLKSDIKRMVWGRMSGRQRFSIERNVDLLTFCW